VYTVRLLTLENQTLLSVFDNASQHADLGDAYMPNADLSSVNLYGATASGIHLYGAGTKLDGAILEAVDFSGANLGTASFTQASLYDAIFDDAILTGASFEGAHLEPGQAGRGVSLQRANLQGTDFSGATLYGANLQDAAVCLPDSSAPQGTDGVWLYEVLSTDTLYQTYLTELNAAANLFTLDPQPWESHLQPGAVDSGFRAAFAEASQGIMLSADAQVSVTLDVLTYEVVDQGVSYPLLQGYDESGTAAWVVVPSDAPGNTFTVPLADGQHLEPGPVPSQLQSDFQTQGVALSSCAQVQTFQRPVIWQIVDTTASYTLWDGYDTNAVWQLFARPAIPNLTTLFQVFGVSLLRTTLTGSGPWIVDNDSESAYNFTTGYIVFTARLDPKTNALDIYGSRVRIEQLSDGDQLQYHDIVAATTQISVANFDDSTIYPNGNKETIFAGQMEPAWFRAKTPPTPPTCVYTSGDYYCPPTSSAHERQRRRSSEAGKPES
jgi:uncharacterized protein YjbI with pentapeptide repeats